jgi:hypothetical protein
MPWRRQLADIPFEGIFRRQLDIRSHDAHTVVGWLEDEFHHFGVTIEHDGGIIRDVRVAAPRHPWTTCAQAGTPLKALIGQPLAPHCCAIGAMLDLRRNCTHVADLASVVLAHAYAPRPPCRYHGTVERLDACVAGAPADLLRVTLRENDLVVLEWDMQEYLIVAPEPWAGRNILHGFRDWVEARGADGLEHALVLRRVASVAFGRRIVLDHAATAADLGQGPVCHSFQPEWRHIALRMPDTQRRFDSTPAAMLAYADNMP